MQCTNYIISHQLNNCCTGIQQCGCSWQYCTAKSLQSCPILCDPIDSSPPGSPVPGILQTRTLEWVAISSSHAWKWKVKVKSFSRVQPSVTPWIVTPSMGFSRGAIAFSDNIVLCTFNLLETQILGVLNIKEKKEKMAKVENDVCVYWLGCGEWFTGSIR